MKCIALPGLVLAFLFASIAVAQLPPGIVDTQPNGDMPPVPQESLAKITAPEGFTVTLFAGEPDVHQPIAMEFDDRGRLWVVECFSYPGWQDAGQDRILVFEDSNNDGEFDSRKVFADKLRNVTGLALGFGGVWICSAPDFLFIPDADRDDVPDGPAVVKLDGWNDNKNSVKHNVYNELKWGPDGWMYGGHGILDSSLVGKPGAPPSERQRLNCGIWRYHPVRDKFEIVAHGTTNPWGIDFNEMGQGFFTNSVIGHFWHLIPGARYKRMYGSHFNPYTYTLIGECADHFHWGDAKWQESRSAAGVHGEAGGGHAHVGALIYQGGRWPKEYHGSLFTANLHGNRLNRDLLQQKGSGYVASHGRDFLFGNDPWFRGIGIKCGPDGNVVVSDWTDLGECHDSDGTHRSSGRIYKISHGGPVELGKLNLAEATNEELFAYIDHKNKWYWERARRLLHERATAGSDMQGIVELVRSQFGQTELLVKKLRLASLMALVGGADDKFIDRLLNDPSEHAKSWAVRYLSQETELSKERISQFAGMAKSTDSLCVRLELTAALQRVPIDTRWDLALALLESFPAEPDQNLLPMTWFGIEPLANVNAEKFLQHATIQPDNGQLSDIRQFIVRRLLADQEDPSVQIEAVLRVSDPLPKAAIRDIAMGIQTAMEGRRVSRPPKRWVAWRAKHVGNSDLQPIVLALGAKFKDSKSIKILQTKVQDRSLDLKQRQESLAILTTEKTPGTLLLLQQSLSEKSMRLTAVQQLGQFNDQAVPRALLAFFSRLSATEQSAAVDTLCSTTSGTLALLNAVERKDVPVETIRPTHAAKISRMKNKALRAKLIAVWGDVRNTPREAKQKIADWKAILTSKKMASPNLARGKVVYAENCGKCHKLFGQGGDIGPELTGADRRNLDYLLQNVITPSAVVGKDHRLQTVILEDGRTVSGAIQNETPATIEVQTIEKQVTIARSDISSIEPSELSLMPEGQFDVLPKEDVRDLIGYLRAEP